MFGLIKLFWGIRALLYKPFFKKIGALSYIGKPIIILGARNISIGKKVRIFPHVRMECHGSKSSIYIEDEVGIAQNVHITSGAKLRIGRSSTILANVFITNIDHQYSQVDMKVLDQSWNVKETIIGENCFIGIGACIQAGTILGKQCIVGANSVVRGSFPDYCVIVGTPARVVKRYNFETKNWEKI
ncbi:DapH/DapD/GlmU-related protein [Sphingobacterium corticibacter]|uniref:Lipopolysaccharide biosynthesis protein n=1 Tax=Sphingobacterium corticibacter TaxID=2171749 RepID=A0A2T8HJM7_9SPHI|nr:DapH/DapD/GlmU-related protein [Sphingobacterium corticibacter]PVH25605.1 lipopolysaccharide biosynthesis protein [Sphingobacterium corticibacter]